MTAGLRSFFGILIAIVLVALGIYGLQNQEHVSVYFLFFTFHGTQAWIPAGVFALLILAICLLYGLFSGTVWQFRRRRLVRATSEHQSRADSLSTQLEEARAEVTRLREAATHREEERPVTDALRTDRPPQPSPRAQEPPAPAQGPPAQSTPRAQEPPGRSTPPSEERPAPSHEPPPSEEPHTQPPQD